MTLRRILKFAVVGVVLLLSTVAVPASAGTTPVRAVGATGVHAVQASPALTAYPAAQDKGPLRWQRIRYGPFTDPAGDVCRFAVRGQTVRQDVWYRTSDRYANGDPKDQVYVGPLYARYTNEATGKSIVGNLSGSASVHFDRDGTQLWYVVGPFGVTFHVGNPYHRPGEYILGGLTELEIHPGGVPQIRYHRGPTTDVCTALT